MTEPIERELAELFSERAERLDVRPPLPMAHHRRARLQSGLAVASVIAVIAGAGVVGARLATQADGRDAAVASSGDAAHDLVQAIQRLQGGRWHVVVNLGGGAGSASVIDVDWPAKSAIVRADGRVTAIQIRGRTYHALPPDAAVGRFLPPGAKWQEGPDSGTSFGAGGVVDFGWSGFVPDGSRVSAGLPGVDVTRTRAGFRVDAKGTGMDRTVSDIRVGSGGVITAVHSVVTTSFPGGNPAGSRFVVEATISPLTAPLHVAAPDPRTVVTTAQWEAAMAKTNGQVSHCTTTPPSTGPDGARHPAMTLCTGHTTVQPHQLTPTPSPT